MLKPKSAAGLTLLQMFVLNIPLSFLGSRLMGLEGIFWAPVVANILTSIVAAVIIRKQMKSLTPNTFKN